MTFVKDPLNATQPREIIEYSQDLEDRVDGGIQEVTEQLAQTATKSEVNQLIGGIAEGTPLFADDVSEMTNTERLYVNLSDGYIYVHDGSVWINTGKQYQSTGLSDMSVNYKKTDFLELDTSRNMFDGDYKSFSLPGGQSSGYTYQENRPDGYGAIIKVKPNEKYSISTKKQFNGVYKIVALDRILVDGEHFLPLDFATTSGTTENGMALTLNTGDLGQYLYIGLTQPTYLKVVENDFPIYPYEDESYPIQPIGIDVYSKKETREIGDKLNLNSVPLKVLENERSENIFDGKMLHIGKYYRVNNGELHDLEWYNTSDYYLLNEGETKLIANRTLRDDRSLIFTFWNNDKTAYLGGTNILGVETNIEVDIPQGAVYVQISASPEDFNGLIVEHGDEITGDGSYYYYPKGLVIPESNISATPLKYNRNILWLGDSLSQLRNLPDLTAEMMRSKVTDGSFAGGSLTRHRFGYHGQSVRPITQQILNNDFSELLDALDYQESEGSNVTAKRVNYNNLVNADYTDFDTVVVFAGTNDFGGAQVDLTEFENDIHILIENLIGINPLMQIYVFTPLYRGDWDTPNNKGKTLVDYNEVIMRVCREYNIPTKDLFTESGINEINATTFLNADLLHQNDDGDRLLASKIAKFISSN